MGFLAKHFHNKQAFDCLLQKGTHTTVCRLHPFVHPLEYRTKDSGNGKQQDTAHPKQQDKPRLEHDQHCKRTDKTCRHTCKRGQNAHRTVAHRSDIAHQTVENLTTMVLTHRTILFFQNRTENTAFELHFQAGTQMFLKIIIEEAQSKLREDDHTENQRITHHSRHISCNRTVDDLTAGKRKEYHYCGKNRIGQNQHQQAKSQPVCCLPHPIEGARITLFFHGVLLSAASNAGKVFSQTAHGTRKTHTAGIRSWWFSHSVSHERTLPSHRESFHR